MIISNEKELRDAWVMVRALSELIPEMKKTHRCKKHIVEYKKAIREYNNHERETKFVAGDYDWYTELIAFEECKTIEEAQTVFDCYFRLHYYPSQYDCTGQAFTSGVKFFIRRGVIMCYHTVSYDV